MKLRRFLIEGTTLIISAIVLGLIANAMASADRKVSLTASPQFSRQAGDGSQNLPEHSSRIIEDREVTSEDMAEDMGLDPSTAVQSPASQQGVRGASRASKSEILERFPPSPEVPAEEIHTDEAHWLWENGALFLDARRSSIYNEGHIAGARAFAVWEADIDEKVMALSAEGIDTSMPIVIYCSGGECEDSHMLAQKLWGLFFNNLRVYYEGYPGWADAGYQVNRGPQP